jgi:hypothetical protein
MYDGIDAVGIDLAPKFEYNVGWYAFFFFFSMLGNLLILNLLIGVV